VKRIGKIQMRVIGGILFLGILLYPLPVIPMGVETITEITLDIRSEALKISLTGPIPVKVFPVGQKEMIIALKNAKLSKYAVKKADNSGLVQKIEPNVLPGNIVVLDVYTHRLLRKIAPEWTDGKRTLTIHLSTPRAVSPSPKPSQSEKTIETSGPTLPSAASSDRIQFPELSIATLEVLEKEPIDSIDGILTAVQTDECLTHPIIRRAVSQCDSNTFLQAYEYLNQNVESDSLGDCLETVYYVRAYAFYKGRDPVVEDQNLKTVSLFQEAVSYYPKSRYVPYGISALGKINRRLKNYDEALGYFKVILDSYNDYSGIPEVMLEMAKLYIDKEKATLAIATLDHLISGYPNNPFISEAKLALGKAFFEANQFQKALTLFTSLIKSAPRIVYESPDLMVYLGNTYYQVGKLTNARDVLLRAINYFPDIPDAHIVLTRIGDIFRDEKQPEKAEKIYELVIKNFPGTDGYIVSSLRMAEFLKRRADKENLYRMIISDFPDHPLTHLAYVKLSSLLNQEGEYEKSIEVIHTFLAKYPGTLKKEAAYVMKDAYGALFRKLFDADDMAGLLIWYERDKSILDRINSPEIYHMVGTAYCLGHLYEEAAKLLEKAYRFSDKGQQSPELVYQLGVSFMESGQPDRALETLEAYSRKYSTHDHLADAFRRIGRLLMEKKDYKSAQNQFRLAFQHTKNKKDKASVRMWEAEASKGLGEYRAAAHNLIQAIDLLSGIPEPSNTTISKLYRDLGNIYLETRSYIKAADALAMSIRFSDQKENPDLRFLLAESYEKGKNLEMAGKVYQQIIEMGDPFWSRLAQEKLRGIQIDTILNPNRIHSG